MRISIEANIGSGKTTLLAGLARQLGTQAGAVFPEPVEEWGEWLARFYDAPGRWACAFNLNVLMSFTRQRAPPAAAAVMQYTIHERSPVSCRYIFTALQHADGHMTDHELALFDQIYEHVSWEPDAVIYLRTAPEECLRRANDRARDAESGLTLEYLRKVHERHEALYGSGGSCKEVHVVDGGQAPEQVLQQVLQILQSTSHAVSRSRCPRSL